MTLAHFVFFLFFFTVLTEAAVSPPVETPEYASLRSMLDDFDVLPVSSLQTHSVRRRDVQTQSHVEKLLSFDALRRHFRLYLRTNDQLFTDDFSVVVVDEDGRGRSFADNRHNYFTGHVIGEEHSRVQAHIDDNEFSARIVTDEAEFHVEPLWRFTAAPPDGRLLVYRSDHIRNLSRLHQPSVCGYVTSDPGLLLPDGVRAALKDEEDEESRSRSKRQALDHRKNTCPLLLVADHRFFQHMGRGEESTTLNYLVPTPSRNLRTSRNRTGF